MAGKYDVEKLDSADSDLNSSGSDDNIPGGPADKVTIRLDRWIASRISLIYSKVDGEQRTTLAGTVNDLTSRLVAASTEGDNVDLSPSDLFEAIKINEE